MNRNNVHSNVITEYVTFFLSGMLIGVNKNYKTIESRALDFVLNFGFVYSI
jgi:hypothetical protein